MNLFYKAIKGIFLSIFLPLACFVSGQTVSNPFLNFQVGGLSSEDFATNLFTAVGVGKGNRIWAGTSFGGLYTYDPGFNIWRKSDKLTNVLINHIQSDPDGGIWIGQSGTQTQPGNTNLAGGVNYFPVNSDISMSFYTIQGTTNSAFLVSRNVRSIWVDPSRGAITKELPKVWAAQGLFTTSFNGTKGGLNVGLNLTQPFFNRITQGLSATANELTSCEAIGGGGREVWVAARPNNGKSQLLRYNRRSRSFIAAIDNTNNTLLSTTFRATAIFFDSKDNQWIGFLTGGLIVKTGTNWFRINFPELFPTAGTAVNNNAICEDEYGNVYFGTSAGLIRFKSPLYNPGSNPSTLSSYEKFTTDDGLPSNNITGLAYDKLRGNIVITSSEGVTFFKVGSPFIEGVVSNASVVIQGETTNGFSRSNLPIGATLDLIEDDELEETIELINAQKFSFEEAENDKNYRLEITARRPNGDIKYIYNNIKNQTLLPPIDFPLAIIDSINVLKPKMETKDIPVELSGIRVKIPVKAGFNTTGIERGWESFLVPEGVSEDHVKKLNNLAIYYASLNCVNDFGDSSIMLLQEGIGALFPLIESLMKTNDYIEGYEDLLETVTPGSQLGINNIDGQKLMLNQVKLGRATLTWMLKKIYALNTLTPKQKQIVEYAAALMNDALDIIEKVAEAYVEEGAGGFKAKAGQEILKANLQKALQSVFAILNYNRYAKLIHADFISTAATRSRIASSEKSFPEVYAWLLDKNGESLTKQVADSTKTRKDNLAFNKKVSEIAAYADKVLDAASNVKYVPSGQAFAVLFKGLSLAAKFVKVAALAAAFAEGLIGAGQIEDISERILDEPELNAIQEVQQTQIVKGNTSLSIPASLEQASNEFKTSVGNLKAVYDGASPLNQYGANLSAYILKDSVYGGELENTLNSLWAVSDTASKYIPGFYSQLSILTDSFLLKLQDLKRPFSFENMSFFFNQADSNKIDLSNTANLIMVTNDSLINRLKNLFTTVNNGNLQTGGYLVISGKQLNHNNNPGSTGSFSYTLKNIGTAPVSNLRVKLTEMNGGFALTSPDSIFSGNILPGNSATFQFSFISPQLDSLGKYYLDVQADNGFFNDISGSLYIVEPGKFYTVQDGNWSNPQTWHTGQVPDATNKVHINHNIILDVNGTCKSLSASTNTSLDIKPGKILDVKE